jgi:hypothetical protein
VDDGRARSAVKGLKGLCSDFFLPFLTEISVHGVIYHCPSKMQIDSTNQYLNVAATQDRVRDQHVLLVEGAVL